MRGRLALAIAAAATIAGTACAGSLAQAGREAAASRPRAVPAVGHEASGRFDVEMVPQTQPEGIPNGRMTIRKTFHGEVSGRSEGEMLTSSDARSGSGAYVAIERFTGRIGGRSGSFYFVHRGIMDAGRPELAITIAPGSGTGGLEGIAGTLHLDLKSKNHAFKLDYTLPNPPKE